MMNIKWTEEIDNFIINNYKGKSIDELCSLLNKKFGVSPSRKKLQNHKHKMIEKGYVFEKIPNYGCFKKGQISFNKGKKWKDYLTKEQQEKARSTCFKLGNIPTNHREIGEERITADGFIEVKIAEPNEWELKHRVIWENINGKLQDGEIVTFLDGNSLNCDINNLTKITRKENLFMNNKGLRAKNIEINKTAILATQLYYKAKEIKQYGNNK